MTLSCSVAAAPALLGLLEQGGTMDGAGRDVGHQRANLGVLLVAEWGSLFGQPTGHKVVRVELELKDAVLEPMHEDFGEQRVASEGALTRWLDAAPDFESDSAALKAVYDKSIIDLAALRIEGTLAGRDAEITGLREQSDERSPRPLPDVGSVDRRPVRRPTAP